VLHHFIYKKLHINIVIFRSISIYSIKMIIFAYSVYLVDSFRSYLKTEVLCHIYDTLVEFPVLKYIHYAFKFDGIGRTTK